MDNNKQKQMVKALIAAMILIIVVGGGYLGYKHFIQKDETSTTQKQLYTCPMHPQIISDHPGQCPICGMDLILKTNTGEETENEQEKNNHVDLSAVKLSPREQILANVQTQVVKLRCTLTSKDRMSALVSLCLSCIHPIWYQPRKNTSLHLKTMTAFQKAGTSLQPGRRKALWMPQDTA